MIGILIILTVGLMITPVVASDWTTPTPLINIPDGFVGEYQIAANDTGEMNIVYLSSIPYTDSNNAITHIITKIVYRDNAGLEKDLAVARQDLINYNYVGTSVANPDICIDGSGNLYVIYIEGGSLMSTSRIHGVWTPPTPLLTVQEGGFGFQLAVNDTGEKNLIYETRSNPSTSPYITKIVYRDNAGLEKDLAVATENFDGVYSGSWVRNPEMSIDRSGNLHVIYIENDVSGGSRLMSTSRIQGVWTPPTPLSTIPDEFWEAEFWGTGDRSLFWSAYQLDVTDTGEKNLIYGTSSHPGTNTHLTRIVYRDNAGLEKDLAVATQNYNGVHWTGPTVVDPTISIDRFGNLYVIYAEINRLESKEILMYTKKLTSDLSISEVKPVQVVWDSDINGDGKIDLVSEKPTTIVANITIDNADALDQNTDIPVRFIYDGQIKDTQSKKVGEIQTNGLINFTFTPPTEGEYEIRVVVDPEELIPESNETNNIHSQKVTVKAVNDLFIGYFPITNPKAPYSTKFSPIDMDDYQSTIDANNKFIQATFPLGNSDFLSEKTDNQISACWTDTNLLYGYVKDTQKVQELGIHTWDPNKKRIYAGIVPDNYFSAHGVENWMGARPRALHNTILATEGYYTVISHETAHVFNLHSGKGNEEYEKVEHKSPTSDYVLGGKAASGFDVTDLYDQGDSNRYIWHGELNQNPLDPLNTLNPFKENGLCLMGKSGLGTYTYYWVREGNPQLPKWICQEDYIDLFKAMRTDTADPELLYISGTFSKEGIFSLDSTYWIDNGIPEDIESGDYSIVLLDKNQQMISTTPFPDPYEVFTDSDGIIKMETGVMGFTIPYPKEVATIQLTHSGEVIGEFNPHEQLLGESFRAIPDSAFGTDQAQRKAELQNDINEINSLIEQQNVLGARNKLEQVKVKLQDWLIDGYQTEDPLQLTKIEVIDVIDNILSRLEVIAPTNNAPNLQNPGDQTITEENPLTINLVATDPDNDPLTYSFTSPNTLTGASISGNIFAWTPGSGTAGKYPVTFNVTDSGGLSDEESINITVNAAIQNTPPVLTNPGDKSVNEGSALQITLVASDKEADPLTYTFRSTKTLTGASISDNIFTWTPGSGTAGIYPVVFNVTDSGGLSDEEKINITVTALTTNVPTNVKIVPRTINIGSKGYFLTFVTLPEAYKGATIDKDTVSCEGAPAVRMMRLKLLPRIVGFVFKTGDLQGVEVGKKVTLDIKGELKNKGTTFTFTGSDNVKVISKPTWQPDDIKDISKESDDQLFKKFNT
jgi:hypothetical protein